MKKTIIIISVILAVFLACYVGYKTSDTCANKRAEKLERTIVLDNGLTYQIRPHYYNNKLCVTLEMTKGMARLYYDENYDVHLIDSKEKDLVSIKFYYNDFTGTSACKCTTMDKGALALGRKFKMRYPAWIEDY